MTMSTNQSLPKFDAPPVVEMVLGVEFADLLGWDIPHYGLFWGMIRDNYRHCTVKEPLLSQIETFGDQGKREINLNFPLVGPLPVRCWYANEAQTWLIQIQRDRFVQNWRKTPDNVEYSHYGQVRQRFEGEFQRFKDFVSSEKIGDLQIRQCEVTYVNHIEPDEGQDALSKLAEILPCWSGSTSGSFLPAVPEVAALKTSYLIPENRGRLHISIQPVFRHADAKELLQMTVTAKVKPLSPDVDEVLPAFDLGHEWAVRGFADFTSAKMHELWKRRQ
ncbi:MAG: TIGR04255 family protein [Blastocatellia bacterium]